MVCGVGTCGGNNTITPNMICIWWEVLRTIRDSFYFYICLLPSSSFLRERSRIVLHLRSLPISDKTLFDLGPFQCHHPEMTNPRYNQYRPPSYTTRRRNATVSSHSLRSSTPIHHISHSCISSMMRCMNNDVQNWCTLFNSKCVSVVEARCSLLLLILHTLWLT